MILISTVLFPQKDKIINASRKAGSFLFLGSEGNVILMPSLVGPWGDVLSWTCHHPCLCGGQPVVFGALRKDDGLTPEERLSKSSSVGQGE